MLSHFETRTAVRVRDIDGDWFLPALDNEHGLVVDAVVFTGLLKVSVLLNRMLQNSVTNLFCRLILVLTDHLFNPEPVLLVASVIDPVCIKEEQVSGAHERDF